MARLSFRCSDELVAKVDEVRGGVARERFLRDLVTRGVDSDAESLERLREDVDKLVKSVSELGVNAAYADRLVDRAEAFRRATQK